MNGSLSANESHTSRQGLEELEAVESLMAMMIHVKDEFVDVRININSHINPTEILKF